MLLLCYSIDRGGYSATPISNSESRPGSITNSDPAFRAFLVSGHKTEKWRKQIRELLLLGSWFTHALTCVLIVGIVDGIPNNIDWLSRQKVTAESIKSHYLHGTSREGSSNVPT